MIKPRLTLHIGLHKTGSTSVQDMLKRHEDYLKSCGVYLPLAGRPNRDRMIHSNIGWEAQNSKMYDIRHGTLEDLSREVKEAGPIRRIVISDEGLSRLSDPEPFLKSLPADDIDVIAYTRQTESLAPSLYCETLKFGRAQTFFEFVDKPPSILFQDAIASRWQNAADNFTAVPIKKFQKGSDLPAHFFDVIGATLPDDAGEAETANSRMGQPEALVLFLVNNLLRKDGSGLPGADINRYRTECRKRARIEGGLAAPRFALTPSEAEYGARALGLREKMQSDESRRLLDHQYWYDVVVDSFTEMFARSPSKAAIRRLKRRMGLFVASGIQIFDKVAAPEERGRP